MRLGSASLSMATMTEPGCGLGAAPLGLGLPARGSAMARTTGSACLQSVEGLACQQAKPQMCVASAIQALL